MNIRRFVEIITESASTSPDLTFSKKGAVYTCVNPFSYHIVRKMPKVYLQMDGLYVDGMLMCKIINLMWGRKIPRRSFDMSGMAVDLFERLNNNDETIYFVGAKQEALESTIQQFRQGYPQMKIAGYRNGYFTTKEERNREIADIVNKNPDFVIVGMGSPLQVQFCIDLKNAGYKGIAFTCGGFLHQTAKRLNYYPDWVNRYNLRAFYRLFHEKGLWGRLYNVLIQFPILFIVDTFLTKVKNSSCNL